MDTVSSLIEKSLQLISVLNESGKKQKQLAEFVPFAVSELQHLRTVLQTCRQTDHGGLQCWVNDQATIASRIKDLVDLYSLTISKQQTEWTGLFFVLKDFLSKPYDILVDAMEEVKQLITESKRRVESYKLGSDGASIFGSNEEPPSHSKELFPVGLNKTIATIAHNLLGEKTDLRTKVLSFFGAGGTGKSILADGVVEFVKMGSDCPHYDGFPHFDHFVWVQLRGVGVSNAIFEQIMEQLKFEKPAQSVDLSKYMREKLKHKRCFFVIDGMESCADWSSVLYALRDDMIGSRVIVTTSSMDMARHCSLNTVVFNMPSLDRNSCGALLTIKACYGVGNLRNMLGLDEVISICEGLPLTIVCFKNYIRGRKTWNEDICLDACKNIGNLISNEKIAFSGLKHILIRSYSDLSPTTKACLLSLSTYPDDHEINCKSLIRRWQAETLVGHDSVEAVAERVFISLHEKNFIVPLKVGISGNMKFIRLNHLAKDFVREKAKYYARRVESSSHNIGQQHNIFRLALINHNPNARAIQKEDLPHCRLFILYGIYSKGIMDFACWTYLWVLILENLNSMTNECLKWLSETPLLKYLSLRGSAYLNKLPESILECNFLETLDLRETSIEQIRAYILVLPNLVHLLGAFSFLWKNGWKKQLPHGKISKLETLSGFYVDGSADFINVLRHMPLLRKIRVLWRRAVEPQVINELLLGLRDHIDREPSSKCSLTVDFSNGSSLDVLDALNLTAEDRVSHVKLCGRLSRVPGFVLLSNVIKLQLCSMDPDTSASLLVESKEMRMLKYLKIKEREAPLSVSSLFIELPHELSFNDEDFMFLKRISLNMQDIPIMHFLGTSDLESIELMELFEKPYG